MNAQLKHALLGLGLVGVLASVVTGGVGWTSVSRLAGQVHSATVVGDAMQAAALADMMHDAIRADVLQSIVSAQTGDAAGLAQSRKDLVEHADELYVQLTAARDADVPQTIKTGIDAALPTVTAYAEQGRAIQELAATDVNAALAKLPAFVAAFEQLEQRLTEPGEALEAYREEVRKDSERVIGSARWQLVLTNALALVAIWVVCLAIVRRIMSSINGAKALARAIAEGDLTQKVQVQGFTEIRELLHHLNEMHGNLQQIVGDVRDVAGAVASGSEQVAQGNQDLASRTETQASSLEETAAAMHQVATSVQTNADQVGQATGLAGRASQVAGEGGAVVSEVIHTMRRIEESSRKISDIIGVIDSIAFQTNILALNAAVEAARAGEAGRGFAVVASEVRSLAGRSAAAAREIKGLILASVEQVNQGTSLVNRAGDTMGNVVQSIGSVTEIMSGITRALQEQSDGVRQISEAVAHLDEATRQNAALVEEGANAAASLRNNSERLVENVAVFRLPGARS